MLRNNGTTYIILYFIAGSAPTADDYNALNSIEDADRANVVRFRNGLATENDTVEVCNGVAGPAIPDAYRERFPTVDNNGNWSEAQPKPDPARVPIPKGVAEEVGKPDAFPTQEDGGLFGNAGNPFGGFNNGGSA